MQIQLQRLLQRTAQLESWGSLPLNDQQLEGFAHQMLEQFWPDTIKPELLLLAKRYNGIFHKDFLLYSFGANSNMIATVFTATLQYPFFNGTISQAIVFGQTQQRVWLFDFHTCTFKVISLDTQHCEMTFLKASDFFGVLFAECTALMGT
jgi:hypothetical protein